MAPGPGQRGDGRHRDVVAEDDRRRARAAAAAVEDDVVDPHPQGGVDVVLDVLRRELHPHRDPARRLPHLVGEAAEVVLVAEVFERRRRDGGGARFQAPHLGDASLHLAAGKVPAGARLGPLAELEVERRCRCGLVERTSRTARWPVRRSTANSRPARCRACPPRPSRCRCRPARRREPAPPWPPPTAPRSSCRSRGWGCRASTAWPRWGPITTSVPTGTSSSWGRRASWAVTNWMLSQLGRSWRGTPIDVTGPWWPRYSRPSLASRRMRPTCGSAASPWGSW